MLGGNSLAMLDSTSLGHCQVNKCINIRGREKKKMTEDEIKALQEAKAESDRKLEAQIEATRVAQEEAAKHKGDVDKTVAELVEERRKKQEAIDRAKLNNGELDITEVIEQAFKAKKDEARKSDFTTALNEFKASKSEFQSDAAGLVYSKFEAGLNRFNFSDVETKEQMKARLEEAYRFLNPSKEGSEEPSYTGSPSNANPVTQSNYTQSADEKKVLESTRMDEAKYKALKGKYRDAFAGLGLE